MRLISRDEMIEGAAQVCHEATRALCDVFGHSALLPWAEAEEWQRDSARKGVAFAMDNPDASPSAQHDAWAADKLAVGWEYGREKDAELKTHPCLVPYEELPPDQRAKDGVFKAIVNTITQETSR